MRNKPKSTGKPRGAPKGNKNALRHGFYSKHFKPNTITRLDKQETSDVQSEIACLRANLDLLMEQIDFSKKYNSDSNGNQLRDEHYLRQLDTMSIITGQISTLIRTLWLTTGREGADYKSIEEAWMEIRMGTNNV